MHRVRTLLPIGCAAAAGIGVRRPDLQPSTRAGLTSISNPRSSGVADNPNPSPTHHHNPNRNPNPHLNPNLNPLTWSAKILSCTFVDTSGT